MRNQSSGMFTFRGMLRATVAAAALSGVLFILPQVASAAGVPAGLLGGGQERQDVVASVQAKLNKSQFKNVQVAEDANHIVTLSGTVSLYEYKADAAKRVHNVKGVTAVRNLIEVAGSAAAVSDKELQDKLVERLQYDRVGYGNTFNAITVQVENGAVTLGGHARTDVDKDSALALVSMTPGVKDVNDSIEVDPVSIMDDQIRLQVARAVYGYSTLNKYAIDPAKPIRIAVQNGHVELYGTVDSEADRNVAYMRANGVPGVFSVKNFLQVAGQPSESARK